MNKKGFFGPQQDSSFRFSTSNITFDDKEESLMSVSQLRMKAEAKMLDDIKSEEGSEETTYRHLSPDHKPLIEAQARETTSTAGFRHMETPQFTFVISQ